MNLKQLSTSTLAAVMMAASVSFTSVAAEPASHNFANFNVRYVNKNNGDTGDKLWDNRGPYVAKIVTDYDFDIVGMEEVTGRNKEKSLNASTGRSQLEDLKAWLSDYSFLEWERSGNSNGKDYSYNVIAYRKARYECLESGCFWLSPSPDTPGPGWDTNPEYSGLWRTCGWAKMKDRNSGQTFVFAVTHVNYGPSEDGKNSGRLISERLAKIAGDLPVMLVGDFNMRRGEHVQAYSGYAANFYDAALTAKENYCLPTTNPSVTFTGQNWYPVGNSLLSGSEFDYCFYRGADVLSRHIITENYGRSVNPSDHFPILMRCVLHSDAAPSVVHVDANASKGGDGSASHPFNSLSEAVEAAGVHGTVKLATGTFSEQVVPQASVTLVGGYSPDFTSVVGRSVIDASGLTGSPFSVPQWYSLTLSNIEIKDYKSTVKVNDGAVQFNGVDLTLDNVYIHDCEAYVSGGAVCMTSGCNLTINGSVFDNNTATDVAGAVSANLTSNLLIAKTSFENNSAKNGSAVMVSDAAEILIRNSAFVANKGKATGALYLNECASAQKVGIVNTTFANNTTDSPSGLPTVVRRSGGAAIATYLTTDVQLNAAHLTVVGNKATFAGSNKTNYAGAAINFFGLGKLDLYNSIIAGNSSDHSVADIVLGEEALAEKMRFNIYTTAESVSFKPDDSDFVASDASAALSSLASLLDGNVSDGHFVANAARYGEGHTPVVRPCDTKYAGKAVNVLTTYQRMLENQFNQDLNGDGSKGGVLTEDQCGYTRLDQSMPGAAEYGVYSGIGEEPVTTLTSTATIHAIGDNVYQVEGASGLLRLYSIDGRMISTFDSNDNNSVKIDLSDFRAGIYVISAGSESFKLVR